MSCDKGGIQIRRLALIAAIRYRLTQLVHGIAAVCWADKTLIVVRCRHVAWQVGGWLFEVDVGGVETGEYGRG